MHTYELAELYRDPLYQKRLLEVGTRAELLAWAAWNDPNGVFLDMDCDAEGLPRLSRAEAANAVLGMIDFPRIAAASLPSPEYRTLRVSDEGSPLVGDYVATLPAPDALGRLRTLRKEAKALGGTTWSNARADVVELPCDDGERLQHVFRWI
ncbi:hypothetical protein [Thioalkalivibrio sp. HL-Eb18]|uniref:hypothetical protein n=1 Tax=Thioalkalivibrio sp. HL-Eb18 TaxID=1266913 RepID=UPI0003747AC9|nr:hypothetical protein [Thioalkalivibrio sp. HL-Eb18]